MQESMFHYLDDLYSNGLKAMEQADQNSTVFWAELTRAQLKLMEQWLDYGNRQLELLTQEKNARDLYQAEAELMVNLGSDVAESMRELMDSTPMDMPLDWPILPIPGAGAGKMAVKGKAKGKAGHRKAA